MLLWKKDLIKKGNEYDIVKLFNYVYLITVNIRGELWAFYTFLQNSGLVVKDVPSQPLPWERTRGGGGEDEGEKDGI